jgi:DNA-binding NarL/FixJ family response regulator
MPTEINVVIADDHPVVRQGLQQAIENATGMKVVAEASDGQEALTQLRQLRPDVAVLDIDMPLMDGFRVAQAVLDEALPVKVIFLTVHSEESFLKKALSVGAHGYLSKESPLAEVVVAINTVISGQDYVSPLMTRQIINGRRLTEQGMGLASLTPAERKVLKLIAEYKTTREISADLSISTRTVETHRANICHKLALRGSHALMKFAVTHQADL